MRYKEWLWLAGWLVAASVHASDAGKGIEGRFKGWAEIDAAGRLQSFEPDGKARPELLAAVKEQLRTVSFAPSLEDGHVVSIRTYLQGGYTLEPGADGNEVRLTLSSVAMGPKPKLTVMPRPPRRIMHDLDTRAWVRMRFTVTTSGRVTALGVEDSQGSGEYLREVRDALAKWQFEPETIEGRPRASLQRQDFMVTSQAGEVPLLPKCAKNQEGRVQVIGSAECPPLFVMQLRRDDTRLGREVRVDNPP